MPERPRIVPPSWTVTASQADDLDLLVAGLQPPLTGFLTGGEARAAAEGRGPDGLPWRGDVALHVDVEVALTAGEVGGLELRDADGTVLADLAVRDVDGTRVGGDVRRRVRRAPVAFADLHLDAAAARQAAGHRPATVVQPSEPPAPDAVAAWRAAAGDDHLVVQPVLARCDEDRWAAEVRALAASLRGTSGTTLQLAPLPRGDAAATRRAVAAIAVGAHRLLDADPRVDEAVCAARGLSLTTSGAPRGRLPPAVEDALAAALPAGGPGVVVLLTGPSGSGKSTVARALRGRLLEHGVRSTLLDGDLVRRTLSRGLGFSPEDRAANVRRIGFVAAEVARHGGVAICAPIAPEDRVRRAVRADVEAAGGRFVLVHVATPLAVCEARDVKGLYALARAGRLPGFTGVDAPYEAPTDAEVVVDTSVEGVTDAIERIAAAAGPRLAVTRRTLVR